MICSEFTQVWTENPVSHEALEAHVGLPIRISRLYLRWLDLVWNGSWGWSPLERFPEHNGASCLGAPLGCKLVWT